MPDSLNPPPETIAPSAKIQLKHGLASEFFAADRARLRFLAGLRAFVVNRLTDDLGQAYETRVKPAFERREGRVPADGPEIHKAMRGDVMFNYYSLLRIHAQGAKYRALAPILARNAARMRQAAKDAPASGSLELDPALAIPRNVSAVDVHLMPGSYVREDEPEGMTAGALYDQGLAIYSFGYMGDNLDDIGRSMAHYVRRRFPDFRPRAILDVGCTVGHNCLPWAQAYPEAETHAVDVAAPVLRYAHARARLQGVPVHFKQMNAADLSRYPDESFDLVFSSMFLHELSLKTQAQVFAEARRVLRPGGLMLHMELPPNGQMSPYQRFFLDWDSYYNNEPFYKTYRDQDPRTLTLNAGFAAEDYLQFVVPSLAFFGEEELDRMIDSQSAQVDSNRTGRTAKGAQRFAFGAWKGRRVTDRFAH